MKRTPPSSSKSFPAGFHFCVGSSSSVTRSGFGDGGLAGGGEGGFAVAYSFNSSSHLARRSWRSWFGRRRFRAGAGVLGVQVTFAWKMCAAIDQRASGHVSRPAGAAGGQRTYLEAICAGKAPVAFDLAVLTEDAGEDARRLARDGRRRDLCTIGGCCSVRGVGDE